jgi:hypothetical protein
VRVDPQRDRRVSVTQSSRDDVNGHAGRRATVAAVWRSPCGDSGGTSSC